LTLFIPLLVSKHPLRKTGRNPYEAAIAAAAGVRNPFKVVKALDELLNNCRLVFRG
jgi:hypothetical protein